MPDEHQRNQTGNGHGCWRCFFCIPSSEYEAFPRQHWPHIHEMTSPLTSFLAPSSRMSGKSSPSLRTRILSRVSCFKKRVSSVFSNSTPFPGNHIGRPDAPGHHGDTYLFPVAASHHQSVSTGDFMPTHSLPSPQLFTHNLDDSDYQSCSATHFAPSSSPQLTQGQALTFQNSSGPRGAFIGAHNFVVKSPVFIEHNTTVDNFMEKLLRETIIGAEFDSSDRHPPPRCHPGTRLAVLQRCLEFIIQCDGIEKLRWVVGPAGVGKSAVMQMVAENAPDGVIFASIFLSSNGRRDGAKVVVTIAYQLAVKCRSYRQYIQDLVGFDPSLLRKSLSVQFNKFIIEPFIHQRLFNPSHQYLIIIDGLDECDNAFTQQEILELISDFCIRYPTSPIAWMVASRPEPHISSFFEKAEVQLAYAKEEIMIDSDEAREDVQRYLRDGLNEIQFGYPTLKWRREWPSELEFTKIATAAGGLFAYASTVIRYIGEPHYGDPAAQLRYVLEVIDANSKGHMSGRDHPLAQLDALYKKILSNIPDDAMINTGKLLLIYLRWGWPRMNFREQCNILGLAEDAAYGALHHLHAVMKIPEPEDADAEPLEYFHKSFEDFLFKRSGFADSIKDEIEQLSVHTSLRIAEEVLEGPGGMAGGEDVDCGKFGRIKGGWDNISLSWPGDERFRMTDDELRIKLYRETMFDICDSFRSDHNLYGNMFCFHVLTTRFIALGRRFPVYELRNSIFDKFRHQLTKLGKLKQVSLRTLDYAAICEDIGLRLTSPPGIDLVRADSWNPSCKHCKGKVDVSHHERGWSTAFRRFVQRHSDKEDGVGDVDIPRFNVVTRKESHREASFGPIYNECGYCSRRLARHFVDNPDQLATVFIDSTEMCYIELSFVDSDDGVSEWRYRFLHSGPPTSMSLV